MPRLNLVTAVCRLCKQIIPVTTSVLQRRTLSTGSSRYVLGIETSCDDTGAAIVDENGRVLSESLFSQLPIHIRNGGIIPPVARDLHRAKIQGVVNECVQASGLDPEQLDAVAVSVKPGMAMALLVGMNHAKEIARKWNKPLIPIHHMEAHCLTIRMVESVDFPFLYLLVSGGHALIGVADDINKYQLFGSTTDDAPGEALDKTCREMRLPLLPQYEKMSGGAVMEDLARFGDRDFFDFPVAMSRRRDCEFSFGGLKWAAKKIIMAEEKKHDFGPHGVIPTAHHLCASFLHAVIRTIAKRVERAMRYIEMYDLLPPERRKLVLSGGVACSSYLREMLAFLCEKNGYTLHVPPPRLCTDNGIMIAWNGMEKLKRNMDLVPIENLHTVDIDAKAPFGEDISSKVTTAGIRIGTVKFPEWSKKIKMDPNDGRSALDIINDRDCDLKVSVAN